MALKPWWSEGGAALPRHDIHSCFTASKFVGKKMSALPVGTSSESWSTLLPFSCTQRASLRPAVGAPPHAWSYGKLLASPNTITLFVSNGDSTDIWYHGYGGTHTNKKTNELLVHACCQPHSCLGNHSKPSPAAHPMQAAQQGNAWSLPGEERTVWEMMGALRPASFTSEGAKCAKSAAIRWCCGSARCMLCRSCMHPVGRKIFSECWEVVELASETPPEGWGGAGGAGTPAMASHSHLSVPPAFCSSSAAASHDLRYP